MASEVGYLVILLVFPLLLRMIFLPKDSLTKLACTWTPILGVPIQVAGARRPRSAHTPAKVIGLRPVTSMHAPAR